MFGLFKVKTETIVSPVNGAIVNLSEVPDEVFSQKMAGDGVAIIPHTNTFVAPVTGVISKIFSTNHAFSIQTKSGLEVMVHIGLDTVELNGKGFKRLAQEGESITLGQPVISADLAFIQSEGKELITPIVVNHEKDLVLEIEKVSVIREGQTIINVNYK